MPKPAPRPRSSDVVVDLLRIGATVRIDAVTGQMTATLERRHFDAADWREIRDVLLGPQRGRAADA